MNKGMLFFIFLFLSWAYLVQAGTKLSVSSLTVDGLQVDNLACDLESTNFLGLMGVVASLATQKSALDRCDPEGNNYHVEWTWKDGKKTNVNILDSRNKTKNQCIETALKKTLATVNGTCKAILIVGPHSS